MSTCYTSESGVHIAIGDNGTVLGIDAQGVHVSLHHGSMLQPIGTNIYLRIRRDETVATPLLGPASCSRFVNNSGTFIATGDWMGISYTCQLVLAPADTTWMWKVALVNHGRNTTTIDLIYVQDIGLTEVGGELNELYVSQYIDHHELHDHQHGRLLCSRQVQLVPGRYPWLMLGSTGRVRSLLTDGMDFFGPTYRQTGIPAALTQPTLAGLRQGETAVAALQEQPFELAPGETTQRGFCARFRDHHPNRTTDTDADAFAPALAALDAATADAVPHPDDAKPPLQSCFSTTALLPVDDLDAGELDHFFGTARRNEETENRTLLSFFTDDLRHVVLRQKEAQVDRPHVNAVQTGTAMLPNDSHFTSTSFMYGIFHSHAAQGNSCFNALLSISNNPLNIYRYTGQRIFATIDNTRYQLGVPSAFEMSRHGSRWVYKHGAYLIQVRAWAMPDQPVLRLDIRCLSGGPCVFSITNHLHAKNEWHTSIDTRIGEILFSPGINSPIHERFPAGRYRMTINSPADIESITQDEAIAENHTGHNPEFLVITTHPVSEFGLNIAGELNGPITQVGSANDASWKAAAAQTASHEQSLCRGLDLNVARLTDPAVAAGIRGIIPWYLLNMQMHFLTPHGSEQPACGAWGTRDVCQGPIELLIAAERYEEARGTLALIFANQQTNGDWPQFWAFDRYRNVRADDSHGDIKFWPILALGAYIRASNDVEFLDQPLPFCNRDGSQADEVANVAEHVERTIALICKTCVPGTHLTAYEEGDWNDSMQPADPSLKERLTSAWTVALNYQAFRAYEEVCRHIGNAAIASRLDELCIRIREDFNRYLIQNGTVAGYGIIEPSGAVTHLLHPSDEKTGIHYRLLPMIRGVISGIFTPDQASHHLALIEAHLKGPDGARLMDRPPAYHGGETGYFQRAESSPFFGREIGMMYMHAHLRYAQCQACAGKAELFLNALRQASPIGLTKLVPQSEPRQANCYYSSSDAAFHSRYEVDAHYENIQLTNMTFKGGWRIYSSGPGIYVGLILTQLLGLQNAFGYTLFDPVMPKALDGLEAEVQLCGRSVTLCYHVSGTNEGVSRIEINGAHTPFARTPHPFRTGGAKISREALSQTLAHDHNRIDIIL